MDGKWFYSIIGPILALVAFLVTYFVDPLKFTSHQTVAAIPAFLFSIIILIINQHIATNREIQKASVFSDRIYEAVKDYLHITPIGTPANALLYVESRLPSLREAQNTSLNTEDENDRSNEKLYETDSYGNLYKKIAVLSSKDLIWKDLGDTRSVGRLRSTASAAAAMAKNRKHSYRYKIIAHNEPQINFIILEYTDGHREVLFNWDFRSSGQDPIVLISRDRHITEMFSIQFNNLWRRASDDHDNIATRSNSVK